MVKKYFQEVREDGGYVRERRTCHNDKPGQLGKERVR